MDAGLLLKGEFTLPIEIDLAALFLFGLTGALAAVKRGYDIIGLYALAFVTAVGGALVRDGIFIQAGPPGIATDSRYILVIVLAGGVVFLFREHVIRFNKVIAWLDALGLGAYAVVGVQKSLHAGLSVAAAVLVGVITASGGGVARDVLVREEPLLFKPGQFYVLAAFAGCLLFVLLTRQLDWEATPAALLTIGATFVVRVLAIVFNWKTQPVWREPQGPR
ncbi:MAG TPA: trimeric intracellular cation channel family protein [Verrucomicrobiota bacterium]|nr:trimeric intracellular cation channel family protein [Verrucomicrobiota bacterium]HNU50353.1 trimeric intracellular cation channel family protein [Verrucomicrobiota bacterium]